MYYICSCLKKTDTLIVSVFCYIIIIEFIRRKEDVLKMNIIEKNLKDIKPYEKNREKFKFT